MAKVTFIDPIKSVSGKLSKKHHVVHCIRQAATNNPEMIRNPQFTQWKDPNREIKQTAAQMAWTQKFGQIANATRARLIDASHMNADRAAFAAQSEYRTSTASFGTSSARKWSKRRVPTRRKKSS